MVILSVFGERVPRPPERGCRTRSRRQLCVGDGSAVTAVVAAIHRLLDRFLRSSPGVL
jgi:hypothetical protein